MKMIILFRPAFVTTGMMMLQLVALLCTFATSVSAVPQFGRPLFHALDESLSGSALVPFETAAPSVAGTASSVASGAASTIGSGNPTVTTTSTVSDAINTAVSSTSASSTATPSLVQSSGASHNLGGVHAVLLFGATAATSAVFFAL